MKSEKLLERVPTISKVHVTQDWLKSFIKTWQGSKNVGEVSDIMKIRKRKAQYLACRLRKMGVAMKKMRRGPSIDYSELSKYLDTLR